MSDEPRTREAGQLINHRSEHTLLASAQYLLQPRRALRLIAIAAAILSIGWFAYFYSRGMTNVYGDGVARVNIARKVVDHPEDSPWQRYVQIGSPWLPLPTVLMLPLVANDSMWRTGLAGSLISMLAFGIAATALYLHARLLYESEGEGCGKALPIVSAAIFLLNPSALYMQATPMTESLFMATLAAAAYLLQRWMADRTPRRLLVAGIVMSLATLTRYEAWPVALLAILIVAVSFEGSFVDRVKSTLLFSLAALSGPAYWLWHNWVIYDDALWFLTGPYSARGLYIQNQATLGWSKIFVGHILLDFLLMLLTVAACTGPLLMALAAAGFARLILIRRRLMFQAAPALLLITPFLFHVWSLYRGEIQIFPLSAFGLLNVRYGLPHLLAIALFAPAAAPLFRRVGIQNSVLIVIVLVVAQYAYLLSDGPSQLPVYQEGYRNGINSRPARERARLSLRLKESRPEPLILMHTGALGPVVTQGGLRFREIIHEGTARWHQVVEAIPNDVSTIIIEQGDPLDQRLRASAGLSRDLAEEFQELFAVGKIQVLRRIERDH